MIATLGAAPHPYPLPVENGERGIANVGASLSPSLRGEGKGEGQSDLSRVAWVTTRLSA